MIRRSPARIRMLAAMHLFRFRFDDFEFLGFSSPEEAFVMTLMLLGCTVIALMAIHAVIERPPDQRRYDPRRPPWRYCSGCGYSLVASRGRCPECGLKIPQWPRER
jgi:uncharacterized paraquat-inducible protein A